MSNTTVRNVICIRTGYDIPPQGGLETNELGFVSGRGGNFLVIGDSDKKPQYVWSYLSHYTTGIANEDGTPTTIGGPSSPIFIENGVFKECGGATISGTIEKADRWSAATKVQTNLGSTAVSSLTGGETTTVGIGVTGTLSITNGGTGSTTAAGAATNIINGQNITPNKITTGASLYDSNPNTGALDLNGSSVIGVRGLWFSAYANTISQGIFFPRSDNANYDRVYAQNGKLYFKPNSGATQYAIFHEGSKAILLKGVTTDSDSIAETYDNPKITFANSDSSQTISLVFTDYDKYIPPASLTLCGNQGDEVFIAPYLKGDFITTGYGTSAPTASAKAGQLYFQVVD